MPGLRDLSNAPTETRKNVLRRVLIVVIFDSLIILLLLSSAGTINWLYAWLYIAAFTLIQLIGLFFIPFDVMAERGKKKENTETWDKLITGLLIPGFMAVYLIAGLDFRWSWSGGMTAGWHIGGILIFLMGCSLELWAMYSNRFFSSEVRLQFDRGHAVCSRGPYRYVRHPGYVGMILLYGFTPIFLGSLWALIPAIMTVILLIVRTALEDRILQNKLPGYREYAERVRFRLIPGIW